MMAPWRPLVLAAALNVSVAVGAATAQTVIVMNAPPGSTVELALNAAVVGSTTADAAGRATVSVNSTTQGLKPETSARIFVEVCDTLRRVLLVEPGMTPPPAGPCARREIAGLYVMRRVTTFVVDISEPAPSVRLRQGPAPAQWFLREPERVKAVTERRRSPKGLALFAGGGLAHFGNTTTVACGTVTDCTGHNDRGALTAGAAVWITRFLAAEASYLKHTDVTAEGKGASYRFNSALTANVVNVVGKLGIPLGRARPYVMAGGTYHQATFITTQIQDERTVTADDVTTTIKGGTQNFGMRTEGWGWLFGAGIEIPVSRRLAIYTEGGRSALKGADRDGGEGKLDDRLTFVVVGLRLQIGR